MPRRIVQVGRSDFISSALRKLPDDLHIVSSRDTPEERLCDLRDDLIVFVPPRTPAMQDYVRFRAWFEQAAKFASPRVHLVLISSIICEVEDSRGPRYQAYRVAKQRLEDDFSGFFLSTEQKYEAYIIRTGMFMQGSLISRSRAIWILAGLLRLFAHSNHFFHYTDRSTLEASFSRISHESRRGISRAVISVPGLDIINAPNFLRSALRKIYVADASKSWNPAGDFEP